MAQLLIKRRGFFRRVFFLFTRLLSILLMGISLAPHLFAYSSIPDNNEWNYNNLRAQSPSETGFEERIRKEISSRSGPMDAAGMEENPSFSLEKPKFPRLHALLQRVNEELEKRIAVASGYGKMAEKMEISQKALDKASDYVALQRRFQEEIMPFQSDPAGFRRFLAGQELPPSDVLEEARRRIVQNSENRLRETDILFIDRSNSLIWALAGALEPYSMEAEDNGVLLQVEDAQGTPRRLGVIAYDADRSDFWTLRALVHETGNTHILEWDSAGQDPLQEWLIEGQQQFSEFDTIMSFAREQNDFGNEVRSLIEEAHESMLSEADMLDDIDDTGNFDFELDDSPTVPDRISLEDKLKWLLESTNPYVERSRLVGQLNNLIGVETVYRIVLTRKPEDLLKEPAIGPHRYNALRILADAMPAFNQKYRARAYGFSGEMYERFLINFGISAVLNNYEYNEESTPRLKEFIEIVMPFFRRFDGTLAVLFGGDNDDQLSIVVRGIILFGEEYMQGRLSRESIEEWVPRLFNSAVRSGRKFADDMVDEAVNSERQIRELVSAAGKSSGPIPGWPTGAPQIEARVFRKFLPLRELPLKLDGPGVHSPEIIDMSFKPEENDRIAVATSGGTVTMWNADAGTVFWTQQLPFGEITHLVFDPTRKLQIGFPGNVFFMMSRQWSRLITLEPKGHWDHSWDNLDSASLIITPLVDDNGFPVSAVISGLSIHPEGRSQIVVSSSSGDGAFLVDPRDGSTKTLKIPDKTIRQIVYNSDGKWFVATTSAGTAHILTGNGFLPVRNIEMGNPPDLSDAVFDNDRSRMAVAEGSDVKIWNLADSNKVEQKSAFGGRVTGLTFNPSGALLAVAREDSGKAHVQILDAATGSLLQDLSAGNGEVKVIRFSYDGKILAVANPQGGIQLWKQSGLEESRLVEQWEGMRSSADSLRTVVVGPSIARQFPALERLARLAYPQIFLEGVNRLDTIISLGAADIDSVIYYGSEEEAAAFASVAGEALSVLAVTPVRSNLFFVQLMEILNQVGVDPVALSNSLERFIQELASSGVAA